MKIISKLKLAGCFLLGLLFTLFTLSTQVNANTELAQLPFYWDFINVEIDVQDNGDMLVTETQKYVFNREHPNERYRYIPLDKVDKITDITVSENNKIIPSQVGKENNQLWIKWKHELNPPESHTFVIKYRVVGGLHVDSVNTQVYWKAIFSDRSSPIQNAKVTVRLPKYLAGKIDFDNYYAPTIPVSSQRLDARTIEFVAQKPLPQGRELEVKVAFPNNILDMQKPKWQQNSLKPEAKNTVQEIIGSILGFVIAIFSIFGIPFLCLISLFSGNNKTSSRRGSGSYGGGGAAGGGGGGGCGGGGGGGGCGGSYGGGG